MKEQTLIEKRRKQHGITLIALVITIIVLLILAGITISSLTDEKGIIKEATNAKELAELASLEEQVELSIMKAEQKHRNPGLNDVIEELKNNKVISKDEQVDPETGAIKTDAGYEITGKLDDYIGKISTGDDINEIQPGQVVKEENKKYTNNGTAVIPEGFAIVPGCDDVSKGLVISDDAGDTEIDNNNIVANGNQFVWIPVDNVDNFIREDGYEKGSKQTYVSSNTCTEPNENANQEEKDLYTAMRDSVTNENNKGFYIGRYEAGRDTDGSVVSKKNKVAYDNIKWGNSTSDLTGGAVELSKNFVKTTYIDKGKTVGVTSTLVYGVQWDATLRFFNDEAYSENSAGKGWYKDNYDIENPNHLTGVNVDANASNKVKNIYDMAGNVWEWTMESYGVFNRVYRGGSYIGTSSDFPVSVRYSFYGPNNSGSGLGFRLALYL